MSFFHKISLICLLFLTSSGRAQVNHGVVKMEDTVHFYFFDLFDDQRSFDWGTVPKNFNFNNYKVYFKNNSQDTLIAGRVTTGDGRVTYVYAGHRKLIFPGGYFVIKPMANTSLRYRIGRFSKSVSMTAIGADTTYRFHHRFTGHFSNDTILPPYVQDIKLKEPLNPPLTAEETKNYWTNLEKIKKLREYRKYKPKSAFSKGNPADVRFNIRLYVTRKGYDVGDDTKVIYRRYNEQVELEQVSVPGEKSYFIFPNQDSVDIAPLEIRLNGRDHGYHKNISATGRQEIFLNIRSKAPYVVDLVKDKELLLKKKAEKQEPLILPSKKPLPQVSFPQQNISLFILDGRSRITENCEAQIFLKTPFPGEKSGWNDLQLKEDHNGLFFFKQRVYVDETIKTVRWRKRGDQNWQNDQVFLNREGVASFLKKPHTNYITYGYYGEVGLNWDQTTFKYRIEDDWVKTNMNLRADSVKRILSWYGISYQLVSMGQIKLVNKNDAMRLHRALNKHFKWSILLPKYEKRRWLCGEARLLFPEEMNQSDIKKLLKHPSIKYAFIPEPQDGIIRVTIHFNEMISPQYHALMHRLFVDERVLKLTTNLCDIPPHG